MQNNLTIETNQLNKGLSLDLLTSLVDDNVLVMMHNGILFSHDGGYIAAQNEPSNNHVCTLPYPIIGCEKLPDGTWCLFLTDNISSEIGIFNEVDFTYITKLNASWLNFHQSNLITGAAKELQTGEFVITFADGRRNPDRRINLSKLTTATNENTRLTKIISPPKVDIEANNSGILPNGSYQAAIRYSNNNQPFGAIYSLTLPVSIWSDTISNGSLEVSVSNIDNDFNFYELIIIQTHKKTTTAKIVGTYPKATSKINIFSFDQPEFIPLKLEELTIENRPFIASDQISSNNQLLFRVGVETIPELNYQLQCFDITSEYVVWQTDEKYHEYGSNVGHYRDETYSYYIDWLHKVGAYSSAYTIPGRIAENNETALATGGDVYEGLIKQCKEETVAKFLVYNTAGKMIPIAVDDDVVCDGQEIGFGKMAYYESTDTYPDNDFQFGKWKNTPIRHHKFPDEAIVPRYEVKKGKTYINLLGIRFKNIPHPKKADGTPDLDWVGYRIIRADRNGHKSVISRGMVTNVRSYMDKEGNEAKEVMYTNYPINDLSPDKFISTQQTVYKNGKEQFYTPATTVYYDRLNFHSPHTSFQRYGLGEELKIETEEKARVTGKFSEVFNHPKEKLLSYFSFWLAAILGAVEALITISGKSTVKSGADRKFTGVDAGQVFNYSEETSLKNVEDLIGADPIALVVDAVKAGSGYSALTVAKKLVQAIASIGLKALTFTFWGIQYADQVLDIIWKFLGWTNYALQYNAHGIFNSQTSVKEGNKRRYVNTYRYLQSGSVSSFKEKLYNNFGKHDTIYIETNQEIGKYKNKDNTRLLVSELSKITDTTLTTAVAFYATSKRKRLNQYGRVDSTNAFVLTHNNYFEALPKAEDKFPTYTTSVIFGGDCYIVKDSYQTKHRFFTQDLSQPFPPPSKDGTEYDYNMYRNIGYPRFWANFFKYDFSELISKKIVNFKSFSRTVSSRHNLDNKGKDDENKFRVDNAYFYTSCNAVIEYFVECDFNLHYREKTTNDTYFYSDKFSSLTDIFRSDRLIKEEQFNYDLSLSIQANQIYAQQQPIDYDPNLYNEQYQYDRNRLLYSLPSFREYKYDNWEYFLTGNQYEFPKAEFGNFISMQRLDRERLMFLFDRASPYITVGKQELQTNDLTITIGDGGLFAQPPTEIMYTKQHYGSSQSKWGAAATIAGTFYIGERQGRFYNYTGQAPKDLTQNGLETWSKQYFPIKFLTYFPTFKDSDNPVCGVGYIISYDATINMLYLSKKDYIPVENELKYIVYNPIKNEFTYKGTKISLTDTKYFHNVSFTLSFSTSLNSFVSFHKWFPDWSIPTENHFITAKGTRLYQHNNNCQSYCNFYGVQYDWLVEYIINNKYKIETLSSLEYYLESYLYQKDCKNKVHIKDENFTHLILSNSEQISGLLELHSKTFPYADVLYPKTTNLGYQILFDKVENKYRINQFTDILKDRNVNNPLLVTDLNGFTFNINPEAINVNKPITERKLFRHYNTKATLIKSGIQDKKMILQLSLAKNLNSYR